MKLSELTARVIDLATAIRDYWEVELPKRHPDYPLVRPGDGDGPPPPEQAELEGLLAGLGDDEVFALALTMRAGWGGVPLDDLQQAFQLTRDWFGDRGSAEAVLADTPALADNLTRGVARLTRNGVSVDGLLGESVCAV